MNFRWRTWWFLIFLCGLGLVLALTSVWPPADFPIGQVVVIPVGASVDEIAAALIKDHVIRSSRIFSFLAERQAATRHLQAGLYQFEKPLLAGEVLKRLATGLSASDPIKFTVPEGLSVKQLTALATSTFPKLSAQEFSDLAGPASGYLFPDTYFLPSALTASQLVVLLRHNFDDKIKPFLKEVSATGHSLGDVVNLAALVEEEAKTKQDREIVAGILWKRLTSGQRLEVDVATSTYARVGLPAAPIVSPGLESILAVLHPKITPNWFYLSDRQGQMHYAQTFAAHKQNIAKYLAK